MAVKQAKVTESDIQAAIKERRNVMVVHYMNRKGEEKRIRNVIHLQNIEEGVFEALLDNDRTLTLLVDKIEAIYDEALEEPIENGHNI